jgi:hypothetical protein
MPTIIAVTPIAMSPQPDGNAKIPGRMSYVYNTRNTKPTILQAWTIVNVCGFNERTKSRKDLELRYHKKKRKIGITTASKRGSGGRLGSVLNRCNADAESEKVNQATMSPAVNFP